MRTKVMLLGTAVASYAVLRWLGTTWGATRAERQRLMPGDEVVTDPAFVTTHAITIDAPPADVWPWLVQMGWHRGGWYTAAWVDRLLFPANWPATDRIIPELQGRRVGDFIPDGPPESECGFVIEELDPDRCLVLHSTTHIPLTWRRKLGASVDWTWSFQLLAERRGRDMGERTRFVFRCRGAAAPPWLAAGFNAVIVPADFVMSRQMLRGVKERSERLSAQRCPALPDVNSIGA